jgi:hypothetical protein
VSIATVYCSLFTAENSPHPIPCPHKKLFAANPKIEPRKLVERKCYFASYEPNLT